MIYEALQKCGAFVTIDLIRETETDAASMQKKYLFTRKGELFKRTIALYLQKAFYIHNCVQLSNGRKSFFYESLAY